MREASHGPRLGGMTPPVARARARRLYLVECFAATRADVREVVRRAGLLGAPDAHARSVACVTGLVVRGDEQVLLIVEGPSQAAVSAASHRAGLLADRVSELSMVAAVSGPPGTP